MMRFCAFLSSCVISSASSCSGSNLLVAPCAHSILWANFGFPSFETRPSAYGGPTRLQFLSADLSGLASCCRESSPVACRGDSPLRVSGFALLLPARRCWAAVTTFFWSINARARRFWLPYFLSKRAHIWCIATLCPTGRKRTSYPTTACRICGSSSNGSWPTP